MKSIYVVLSGMKNFLDRFALEINYPKRQYNQKEVNQMRNNRKRLACCLLNMFILVVTVYLFFPLIRTLEAKNILIEA